jgi:hypothetical protein
MILQEVLQFLNQNNGAMLTILTAVYVLATVATVIFVGRSNKLVRESNKIAREAMELSMSFEKERNRPYVIFDLPIENSVLHATLKNIGKTPAFDVQLVLDDRLASIRHDKKLIPFAQKPISFMAPGRSLCDFMNVTREVFKDNQEYLYSVKISYKDRLGVEYLEDFTVDIDCNKNLSYLIPPEHLKDIASELKNVNGRLGDIGKSLNDLAWEQNSLLEKQYNSEIQDENFNAEEFLKEYFKKTVHHRKVYFELLSHYQTAENEKYRNNLLRCEKLGLIRREKSCFILTELGHRVLDESTDNNNTEKPDSSTAIT